MYALPEEHQESRLENQLFSLACLLSIVTGFLMLVVDTFLSREYISAVLSVTAILISSTFYYRFHYSRKSRSLTVPFSVYLLVMINLAWFTGGGMNTINVLLYFLILFLTLILIPRRLRPVFLFVVLINIVVLSILEIRQFGFTLPETKNPVQTISNVIVMMITFAVGSLLFIFLKNKYEEEQELIRQKNKELDEKNAEIEAQNDDLLQKQEELIAQHDFIEEVNQQLMRQAEELERANRMIQEINNSLESKVQERTVQLGQLSKNMDELFYRSSHDFRRPLTTLMGLWEVARLSVKDQQVFEMFNRVKSTAEHMDRMLSKFLMLYQINHFRHELNCLTLDHSLDRVKAMVEEEGDVHFDFSVDLVNYRRNDSRNQLLEIILINLAENALRFRKKDFSQIKLSIFEEAGILRVHFWDNGMGIPQEFHDRVFEMYFRGSVLSKGNGLGLYVVKKAAEMLHAQVRLRSELHQYSLFEISFPVEVGNGYAHQMPVAALYH